MKSLRQRLRDRLDKNMEEKAKVSSLINVYNARTDADINMTNIQNRWHRHYGKYAELKYNI